MPDLGLEVLFKGSNMLRLLQGLWAAVEISLVSIVTSFPLGIILGIIMTKENILIKFLTKVYLEFIRIMPQLVLLFIVFFGSTKILGINLPGETSARRNFCHYCICFVGCCRNGGFNEKCNIKCASTPV